MSLGLQSFGVFFGALLIDVYKQAYRAGRELSSLDLERLLTATEEHNKFQQQLFARRKELRAHQASAHLNEDGTDVSHECDVSFIRSIFALFVLSVAPCNC